MPTVLRPSFFDRLRGMFSRRIRLLRRLQLRQRQLRAATAPLPRRPAVPDPRYAQAERCRPGPGDPGQPLPRATGGDKSDKISAPAIDVPSGPRPEEAKSELHRRMRRGDRRRIRLG
jgi:hypothetical protein